MSITNGEFELEEYVDIKYEVESSPYVEAVTHLQPEDCSPAEGGVEGCSYEIIIRSESLLHHMEILGNLAANYSEEDIEKAVIADYEANEND